MFDEPEDRIVASGPARTVEYAVTARGKMPALEFLEGLEPRCRQKMLALFQRMADYGQIHDNQKFSKEAGEIYAFKARISKSWLRFPCFCIGRTWLLTHGFRKNSKKWPTAEMTRAERIRKEHIEHWTDN